MSVHFTRHFAQPSADTFDVPPIAFFVKKYLRACKANGGVSVDPFARNRLWADWTNDLNPDTVATFHRTAYVFLRHLRWQGVRVDLAIFDPPYSRRQVMECYAGIGREHTNADSQYFSLNWKNERAVLNDILNVGGIVLSFGWHSNGMQQSGEYELLEQMNIAHGGAHYDTICIAERKLAHQARLL